jgi:transposase
MDGDGQDVPVMRRYSTAAKHGRNLFDTLVMLAQGRPWLPAHT